jgi:hypothetical protein
MTKISDKRTHSYQTLNDEKNHFLLLSSKQMLNSHNYLKQRYRTTIYKSFIKRLFIKINLLLYIASQKYEFYMIYSSMKKQS